MKELILVSGPSCVGKGPLFAALKRYYPEIAFDSVPIIKSKGSRLGKPRPNEVGIWDNPRFFLDDDAFSLLPSDDYIVGDCRGYPQAISLNEIKQSQGSLLLMEVYHTLGAQFSKLNLAGVAVQSVFITPVSLEDLATLKHCGVDTDCYLQALMVHKQIQRAAFMGKTLTAHEIVDIRLRAEDAVREVASAKDYTHIIVNPDGEGHPNWNMRSDHRFYGKPLGQARDALMKLVDVIVSER